MHTLGNCTPSLTAKNHSNKTKALGTEMFAAASSNIQGSLYPFFLTDPMDQCGRGCMYSGNKAASSPMTIVSTL